MFTGARRCVGANTKGYVRVSSAGQRFECHGRANAGGSFHFH